MDNITTFFVKMGFFRYYIVIVTLELEFMLQINMNGKMKQTFLAGGEPTLNNTGYMTGTLDPYSMEFVEYASKTMGSVLDIGACYGVATLPALARGARVVATDNDERHLKILGSRVAAKDRDRLKLIVGSLPNNLNFKKESISAILCCRVLHLLKEDEIETSISHMYEWLERNGRLYLINDTPYARYSDKLLQEFSPLYEQKKQLGIKWPGYISNLKLYLQPEFYHLSPEFVTLTGVDELTKTCEKCGFEIIKSEFIARPDYPQSLQNDGRENAGVLVIKS